jgi:undecaprenyl-diphosphatase
VVVVNPSAGSARSLGGDVREVLERGLPGARVVELGEGEDLPAALEDAAASADVLGIAGGDGSINAAAAVAHARGKPLVVVPAGTLNHLARDVGLTSAADAVRAVADGNAVAVDLACIDGKPFLNTASFGSYVDLVDARQKLERRIGKWPAVLVALWRVLRRSEPVEVEIDGARRRLWMIFLGNCRYEPPGFAPSWRERLDDGVIDVRMVDAVPPLSRSRLLLAVLTGRLGRCVIYEQRFVHELRVRSLQGPLRLARDGETFDGSVEFTVTKLQEPLVLYRPLAGA